MPRTPLVHHAVLKDEGRRAIDGPRLQRNGPQQRRVPEAVVPDVLLGSPVRPGVAHLRRVGGLEGAHAHAPPAAEREAEVQQGGGAVLVRARGDGLVAPPDLRLHGAEVPAPAHDPADEVHEPGQVAAHADALGLRLPLQRLQGHEHRRPAAQVHLAEALHEGQHPSGCPFEVADAGSARHKRGGLEAPAMHRVPIGLQEGLLLAAQLEVPPAPPSRHGLRLLVGPLVHDAVEGPLRVLTEVVHQRLGVRAARAASEDRGRALAVHVAAVEQLALRV
mmetsp:Transcript_88570/g.275546  ORF Transcript_88570/g.275546 Transcript_88570/m.275546 type:complete len:277 (+) Transcript_88570:376-1206(+)